MDHYIDIRLLPDPEFPGNLLMNALFTKLHRGLVKAGESRIGVSFPQHNNQAPRLGDQLRLHGRKTDLKQLMAIYWLSGMRDHVQVNGPNPVPAPEGYRQVRRVQAKSNPNRLRRRHIKRHGVSEVIARQALPDSIAERLALPYASLRSQSTGQHFRLFIEHSPLMPEPVPGTFSQYGLSSTATIPWF